MDIERKQNESIKAYKMRLCGNKDVYGITFDKIAELINAETGEKRSEGYYRRWWNGYKEGFEDGVSRDKGTLVELSNLKEEYDKLKARYRDYKNALLNNTRNSARMDEFKSLISECISDTEPLSKYDENYVLLSDNDLMVCLDDIHYGYYVDNEWNKYSIEILRVRLWTYYNKIISIARLHSSQNCYIFSNGDLISGNIHKTIQISNRINVVQQIMGVSELLSDFINRLCYNFNNVFFACVPGNHSRLDTYKDSPKDERLDDLIPWYISERVRCDNFIIRKNRLDSTFNVVNIRGKNYLNVHGDLDNFENVHKIISMINEPIYCVHFAHLHNNASDYINGYKVIRSGSMVGMDDYCISKRIRSYPQQMVCVCDDKGIVCSYDVNLGDSDGG